MKTYTDKYSAYFWRKFFLFFIPIFSIVIISEPYIVRNSFQTLEDLGEFFLFLFMDAFVVSGYIAFFLSLFWRLKKKKESKQD